MAKLVASPHPSHDVHCAAVPRLMKKRPPLGPTVQSKKDSVQFVMGAGLRPGMSGPLVGRLTLRAKVVFWARCHRCLFGAEIGAIYPKGLKERQQARSWKTPAWLQGQGEHTTLSAICSSCTNSFSLRFKWASIVYPTRALNLRRTTLAWIVPDPTAWKRNQGISSFLLLVSDQIEIGSRGPFGGNARFPHSRGLEDVL